MMLRKANRKPPARSTSKPAAAKSAAPKGGVPKKATPKATVKAPRGKTKPWTADEIAEAFRRFRAANPEPKGELEHINPYTLLVAVVLSAQATDAGVNKATKQLFALADTPEKMVALGVDKVQELIKTIGLYRNKAKNVIALSEKLIAEHNGRVPPVREALEQLPGVGRKTANVVLNIAFGEPTIAVDTHVFRVCNRTGLATGATPLDVETRLEAVVPPAAKRHAHHWLILHGRYVCTAMRPRCVTCLINDLCRWEGKTGASTESKLIETIQFSGQEPLSTMPTESEEVEHKSQLEWDGHQKFDIAKTLIAFANGQGGRILIDKFIGKQDVLDSARLDDFVNKYCRPRISNITSSKIDSEKWEIQVSPSPLAPHVISQEGSYTNEYGKSRSAFYPGQIYVRHSSKSEPASGEDVQKIIQQIVGSWLSKLGKSIETLSTRITDDLGSLPVRIVEQGGDMTLEIKDVRNEYPYYATNLAEKIGRSGYWVGKTANAQGLKTNPTYCYEIKGPSGRALYVLYSEAALQKLKSISEQEKGSGD